MKQRLFMYLFIFTLLLVIFQFVNSKNIIESYDEKPLSVRLPDTIIAEIVESEPVVKGQTATTSFKPAILDNGVKIMVPPHIGTDVRVVVRTEDSSYVEKAKD